MARDINDRLARLNTRRKGTDRLSRLSMDAAGEVLSRSTILESWQKRATSQPHTRYALGSMEAVTERYTQIGIETAERVGRQLSLNLSRPVIFRLQGSLPLNVHIRGVSDVDLLSIDQDFLTYATLGSRGRGSYYASTQLSSLGVLYSMRVDAEKVLKDKYPGVTVDCSGGKSIALSGGSLARPVDVVPAHWHDTIEYQDSQVEHDRGVTILNKKVPETVGNLPFLHIKRVHDRDGALLGGLKKAIRLVKNVKNDAEDETSASKLASFDIASLMYHADQSAMQSGFYYELSILQEAQRFFDWCYRNKDAAKSLRTPDNSRTILNTDDKFAGLATISLELDALATRVAQEQNTAIAVPETTDWGKIHETLRSARIPNAAL